MTDDQMTELRARARSDGETTTDAARDALQRAFEEWRDAAMAARGIDDLTEGEERDLRDAYFEGFGIAI